MEEDLIAKLRIKELNIVDIDLLVSNFAKVGWHKPKEIFE